MATAARATEIKVTPKDGTELTATMPVSAAPIQDDETVEKQFSDSRQKSIFGGSEVKGIRFTVCDLEFYKALKKNTRLTSASFKLESATDADGTLLDAGDALTVSMTGGYISEDPSEDSSVDGEPIEWTFTAMLCRAADGTEGTFTVT